MTWLLKNHKWIYAAMVGVGAVCTLLPLWSAEVAACYFVVVLVCLVAGGRWLGGVAGRGVEAFYRDCDPRAMLDNCDRLLAGEDRGGYLTTVGLYRVEGLLATGRRAEAGAELERLARGVSREKATAASVTLRWEQALRNLEEERLGGLEQELDAIAALARRVRVPSLFAGMSFPELMGWHVERGRCQLLLCTAGPVLELLPRLRELLKGAPCTLYQIRVVMDMAEYHLARGETDHALSCLRLVAEKAPGLAMGARARNKLSHMGE